MPPSIAGAQLAQVAPTAEELAQAKQILKAANSKEIRSKMQSMTNWLAAHPDGNHDATDARGEKRKGYLETWLVHNLRCKGKTKTASTTKIESNEKQDFLDEEWMSMEQMDDKFGKIKAARLRASGKLDVQPCSITGEDTEEMREYSIPKKWRRFLNVDGNKAEIHVTGEAGEDDLRLLQDVKKPGEGTGTGSNEPMVKVEPLSKAELAEREYQEFLSKVPSHLRSFQEMDAESRGLMAHLKSRKWSADIQEALKKHQSRLVKLIAMLARACEEPVAKTEHKQLCAAMKLVRTSQNELCKEGQCFGWTNPAAKRRKKSGLNFTE